MRAKAFSLFFFSLVLVLGLSPDAAQAQPEAVETDVMVRVVSQDAKVLHDGVGGARVTIRDAETGEVLSEGIQQGSSGDTDLIMRTPRERSASVYDTPETAGYKATLELERPTEVEIEAEGPLDIPHAMQRASTTMLLVPGQDVLGDGIVLTLHGFIVEVLQPGNGAAAGEKISVRARVRMMCGCPITPGGLWDADEITVTARLVREGEVIEEELLRYAGEASIFEGMLERPGTGPFELQVLATDAEEANFGVDQQRLHASE